MIVFLTGFMGCGKSTNGRKLAAAMQYAFIDLDAEIEKLANESIAGYFDAHGEHAFRELESMLLKTFNFPPNAIVATGGGTPCYADNMNWMISNGLTIYIEMTPSALAKRLERGKDKRPLIRNLSQQELISFIQQKLLEREPFYKRAEVVLNGLNFDVQDCKQIVLNATQKRRR
ncbi:shikimate kinase [Pedobacter deserti]|uniref:shikimate kinase n=1 Tax=Pedobacter deserti TaxID=2817382 RepID=UPI00210A55C0|nr:shikimate kinase [Pedobacter sp. SYSU D00382]